MVNSNTIDQIKAELSKIGCDSKKLEVYAKQLNQLLSSMDMVANYPFPRKATIKKQLDGFEKHLSKALKIFSGDENESQADFAQRIAISRYISEAISKDLGILESGHEIKNMWIRRTVDMISYAKEAKKKLSADIKKGRTTRTESYILDEIFNIYSEITKDLSVRGRLFEKFLLNLITIHKGLEDKSMKNYPIPEELKNLENFRKQSIKK